jgi:hypothetical protein
VKLSDLYREFVFNQQSELARAKDAFAGALAQLTADIHGDLQMSLKELFEQSTPATLQHEESGQRKALRRLAKHNG